MLTTIILFLVNFNYPQVCHWSSCPNAALASLVKEENCYVLFQRSDNGSTFLTSTLQALAFTAEKYSYRHCQQ